MPKKPGSHHVVPNADGGWDVKKDGATHSSGHFDKKQEAIDAGRRGFFWRVSGFSWSGNFPERRLSFDFSSTRFLILGYAAKVK